MVLLEKGTHKITLISQNICVMLRIQKREIIKNDQYSEVQITISNIEIEMAL